MRQEKRHRLLKSKASQLTNHGRSSMKDVEPHISRAMYDTIYDFPEYSSRPRIQLMVASSPRSGSTAFCMDLWRLGALGAPLEYFNFGVICKTERWGKYLSDGRRYWSELQRKRTSRNGVFSYKFFISNYYEVAMVVPLLLPKIAPSLVIYLTRQDRLAQAISHAKAMKSGVWFGGHGSVDRIEDVKVDEVRRAYYWIRSQDIRWKEVFAMTGAEPLCVNYEEWISNRTRTLQTIVEFVLGENGSLKPQHIPSLTVQRDLDSGRLYLEMKELVPMWEAEPIEIAPVLS